MRVSSNELFSTLKICLESCTDPRLLACLHTACRECIDRLYVTAGVGGPALAVVKCPVCRTLCPITKRGAAALPRNSIVPSKQDAECDVCRSAEVNAWCSTCEVFVCNSHLSEHIFSSASMQDKTDHVFKVLGNPQGQSSQRRRVKEAVTPCPSHGQPLLYLCQGCDVSVCGECAALGSHVGHRMVNAASVVTERQAKVSDGVERLRGEVEPCLVRLLEKVDDVAKQLGANADEARDKIEAATLRAIEAVKLSAVRLRQEVEDEEQSRTKVLDEQRDGLKHQLEAVRGAASFGEEAVRQVEEHSSASLPLLIAVETRIAAICEEEIKEEPAHHPDMNFQSPQAMVLEKKAAEFIGEMVLHNASASHSLIKNGLVKTKMVGGAAEAVLVVKDKRNTLVTNLNKTAIKTTWLSCPAKSAEDVPVVVSETGTPGEYKLTTRPAVCGEYTLEVSINQVAMPKPVRINMFLAMSFDPDDCDESITLSENLCKATITLGRNNDVSVFGRQGMRRGHHSWKIRIGPTSHWCRLGINSKELRAKGFSGGFSWSSGGGRFGSTHDKNPFRKWQGNDCLQFHLDCEQHTLEMTNLRGNDSHTIRSLPDTEFVVFATMNQAGNSVSFE